MSDGLCRTELIGNVCADAELKMSKRDKPYTSFSLAVNRSNKRDGNWVEEVKYYKVILFGKRAERLVKHIGKGRQMRVVGELDAEAYLPKDWQKGDPIKTQQVMYPEYHRDAITLFGAAKNDKHEIGDANEIYDEVEFSSDLFGSEDIEREGSKISEE